RPLRSSLSPPSRREHDNPVMFGAGSDTVPKRSSWNAFGRSGPRTYPSSRGDITYEVNLDALPAPGTVTRVALGPGTATTYRGRYTRREKSQIAYGPTCVRVCGGSMWFPASARSLALPAKRTTVVRRGLIAVVSYSFCRWTPIAAATTLSFVAALSR